MLKEPISSVGNNSRPELTDCVTTACVTMVTQRHVHLRRSLSLVVCVRAYLNLGPCILLYGSSTAPCTAVQCRLVQAVDLQ